MRLSLPSVAILSLFAAGDAFTPPTPAATRTPRLFAGSDLSGMLSEYSTSSAPAATAKVVEKVVAVPPPPPQPQVAEAADAGMEALSQAATAAQEAADQAAAAAAAAAAKGAAVTKAAATAAGTAGTAAGVKFQPLVKAGAIGAANYIPKPVQVDPSKATPGNAFDAQERARENLALMKANFLSGLDSLMGSAGSLQESAGSLKNTVADGRAGGVSMDFDVKSLVNVDAMSISPAANDIIASLHLKEYGGWYAAAFMAAYASQQRSAGEEDATAAFESELANAREKASEAASAAGLAAQGATTAKKLALKMEKDLKKDGSAEVLKDSRSRIVEMEKNLMEKEITALKAEVSLLRSQLAKAEGGKKKEAPKKAKKTEIEIEYPTKVVMESDPDEEARILELLKEVDEENKLKKKNAAEVAEKKREEEAKFVATEKAKEESRKMTKGVEAAQAKAEVAKKKKKAATKKSRKTSTKAKTVAKKGTTNKAATKKAATKKAATKKKAPARVVAVDDWSLLADSTLKRKTVAQLTDYLTGKGVTATDSAGKSLKKAELLEAVRGL